MSVLSALLLSALPLKRRQKMLFVEKGNKQTTKLTDYPHYTPELYVRQETLTKESIKVPQVIKLDAELLRERTFNLDGVTRLGWARKFVRQLSSSSALGQAARKSCATTYAMLSQLWEKFFRKAMFRVEDVPGKGKGCLASRRMEAGELILREAPALLLQPRRDAEEDDEGEDEEVETLEAFQAMSTDQQTAFLQLANMYNTNRERSEWPSVMVEFKESIREDVKNALRHDGISMDLETAVEVVEIKETNSFHNGVFLRMSRFTRLVLTFFDES